MPLAHVAQKIMGRHIEFVKYPNLEEKMASSMKVGDL